jgi:hypothetical protein
MRLSGWLGRPNHRKASEPQPRELNGLYPAWTSQCVASMVMHVAV